MGRDKPRVGRLPGTAAGADPRVTRGLAGQLGGFQRGGDHLDAAAEEGTRVNGRALSLDDHRRPAAGIGKKPLHRAIA